jgi:hypothetical protein
VDRIDGHHPDAGNFGRSVKATLDYLAGTVAGAVYAGAVAAFVPHANEIALIGVLVIVVAPLALVEAIKPSFSVSTFTGVLVILVPGITHVTPIESAFYRVVEVAIGGVIALAVSVVVLPTRAHSLAIEAAAQTINLMARCLPELFAGFVQTRDATALERIHENIGGAITQLNAITEEAKHEWIGLFHPEPDLGPLMRTLLRLRYDLIVIAPGRFRATPSKVARAAWATPHARRRNRCQLSAPKRRSAGSRPCTVIHWRFRSSSRQLRGGFGNDSA